MRKYHLLVIEDDPAVGESLRAGLAREGFDVTWKSTGAEGTASAQKDPPHLVLLDLRLPDGSGLDVCRQMRQMGLHQPIVMLIARGEELDKVLGSEMGADDYVTKPFGLPELVARIRAQLSRAYGDYSPGESATSLLAGKTSESSGEVQLAQMSNGIPGGRQCIRLG